MVKELIAENSRNMRKVEMKEKNTYIKWMIVILRYMLVVES